MITVTLFTGCNNEPPKPQVVLLNMGAVGDATGITERVKERMATINQQISSETRTVIARLNKEFEDEKASLGDKLSEEDEKKIQTLQEQRKYQVTQARKEEKSRRTKEISELKSKIVSLRFCFLILCFSKLTRAFTNSFISLSFTSKIPVA